MIKTIEAPRIRNSRVLRSTKIPLKLWRRWIKALLPFILLFFILIVAVWPLLKSGFFITDDGEWMVVRLTDFHRSLVSGMFPIRWAARLNHQFGYPVFNFLYPLSLYWGEAFHLIGFNFVDSIKLVFVASFFLSAFFMYLFTRELWQDKRAAFLSAIFYSFAPYRFLDVYVRGSIGEAVSFIFVPLIFWSLHFLSKKKNFLILSLGAIGVAGLIMSHNIMAMLFFPLALFYAGFLISRKQSLLKDYGLLFALGLGLAFFFWFPALYDTRFIILNQVTVADFANHFPTLGQLLIPSWGYGPSLVGGQDTASYQLGLFQLGAVLIALLLFWKERQKRIYLKIFLFFFFASLFLMLPVSSFIWRNLPMIQQTQFPWRLLSVTTFSASVLAGTVLFLFKKELSKTLLTVALTVLVVLASFSYVKPKEFIDRGEGFYATNEATTTVKDEYLPIWVKQKPEARPEQRVEVIEGKAGVENLVFNSKKATFNVDVQEAARLQINTVYFPGWQLKVDDEIKEILFENDRGLIIFEVDQGEHLVVVEFKETSWRLVANYISLLSAVFVAGLIGWSLFQRLQGKCRGSAECGIAQPRKKPSEGASFKKK